MITKLETGYQPTETDLSAIDKKALFNNFAKARYMFRRLMRLERKQRNLIERQKKVEAYAKKVGDLSLLRDSRNMLESLARWGGWDLILFKKNFVDVMLNNAALIDQVATFDEQAALLGISTVAARRALKPYAEGRDEKRESFTLLLTRRPESHPDPDVEWAIWDAILEKIFESPILHRQATKELNEVFGREIFPLPSVPRPTIVNPGVTR